MKGFELNGSKKTIAFNISYFLNTAFIRYSRPQTFEIWHVLCQVLGYPIVRFLQHSDVLYKLEPHQFHPGLILSLRSFCFLINTTPIHVVSLHLDSSKLLLNVSVLRAERSTGLMRRLNSISPSKWQLLFTHTHTHTHTHTQTHTRWPQYISNFRTLNERH
jgi:hypothetical protein